MARIIPPGGRLTLVQGQPLMPADVTSATVWYAPYDGGDSYPNLDSALTWQVVPYTASPIDSVGASLSCRSKWSAGQSYDVFGLAGGIIGTGPAWPASDDASRNLIRYNGIKVNNTTLMIDLSSTSNILVSRHQATYLGSIHCSVTGQLTANFSNGQDRKFEVWTAYSCNQVHIVQHVSQTIASGTWTPTNKYQNGFVPYNNDPTNRANIFTGDLTLVDVTYHQNMFVNSSVGGPSGAIAVIGWNGILAGHGECFSSDTPYIAGSNTGAAHYSNSAAIGLNVVTMLCACVNAPNTVLFSGGNAGISSLYEGNQVMFARYLG